MLVAGKPFLKSQSSRASAPLFVSTKTKVRACCITEIKQKIMKKSVSSSEM
jgi:hypothetical protein